MIPAIAALPHLRTFLQSHEPTLMILIGLALLMGWREYLLRSGEKKESDKLTRADLRQRDDIGERGE